MSFTRLLLLFALATTALVAASDFSALDQKAGGAGTGGGTGGGAGTGNGSSGAAKQFHLSFIGASKTNAKLAHYTIDWVTPATTTASQLVYGTSADALTTRVNGKSSGTVDEGAGKTVMCWSALVQNVAVGSTIYYALADDTSKPKSFTAQPADGFTWAVFGDLGAPAQKGASGVALPALKNALDVTKAYHGVLNIGDLAYELVGSNGKNYMDELESITSQVPMQVTVGNVRPALLLPSMSLPLLCDRKVVYCCCESNTLVASLCSRSTSTSTACRQTLRCRTTTAASLASRSALAP